MIYITKDQFEAIVTHAKSCLPNEACGLLGGVVEGNKKIVKKVYYLTNVDHSPEHFSMEPKEQFGAVKDMRANGWALLGNWHSHPSSPPRMSDEDKRLAFDTELSYLILSLADRRPVLKGFNIDSGKNVIAEDLIID